MIPVKLKQWMPLMIAAISMALYYAALPPLSLFPLAFSAPILWFFLIIMEPPLPKSVNQTVLSSSSNTETPKKRSVSRRFFRFFRSFYGQLYLASFLFWGTALLWLPLPHPAIWFGWFGLGAYMAIYFPVFIGVSRILTQTSHFRSMLFTPAFVWIGTEWFRKHLLGGFSFCSLEHAFYLKPVFIQTAEIIGEYGVSALIILIGTAFGMGIYQLFCLSKNRWSLRKSLIPLGIGIAILTGMVLYGYEAIRRIDRILASEANGRSEIVTQAETTGIDTPNIPKLSANSADQTGSRRSIRVALLQDGTCYQFPVNPELNRLVHRRYMTLSRQAVSQSKSESRSNRPLDLLVWPEGTFCYPYYEFTNDAVFPTEDGLRLSPDEEKKAIGQILTTQKKTLDDWVTSLGCPVILGLTSLVYDRDQTRVYNSALYLAPNGSRQCYDKRHRVMFGEYIPFLENLPDSFPLKTLCIPISAGKKLGVVPLPDDRIAMVSICYESAFPHFVRSQIDALGRTEKQAPEFLVNISNDAWFDGGVENELHAATYSFRAVETRKFYLTATHGGTSRVFDPAGRIIASGVKGESSVITAEIPPCPIKPVWNGRGLLIPPLCALLIPAAFILTCWRSRRSTRRASIVSSLSPELSSPTSGDPDN